MPLALCPACSATISAEAHACPYCGHPLPLTPAARGQLMAILALVVIGTVLAGAAFLAVFAWDDILTIVRHLLGR